MFSIVDAWNVSNTVGIWRGGGIYSVKSSYRGRINVMRIKGCRWESNPSIKHMSNSDECEKS
jgi:hypothetical protein